MPRSFGSHDPDHADRHDDHAPQRGGGRSPMQGKRGKGGKSAGERGGRSGQGTAKPPVERSESPLRATFGASLDAAARVATGSGLSGRAPSQRVAQVSALIARVLRERLSRGINDPRVQGMVSILGVECTADLVTASVRVSVLPAERARLTLSGLRSATRHLEGIVRKATRLRRVPKLLFELDDSIKREAALADSLNAVRAHAADETADEPQPDQLDQLDGQTDRDDATL